MYKAPIFKIEKSVFVVTYGRSGSTVLQNMLNALPGHILRGENAGLLAPLVRAWQDLRQFYPEQVARMQTAGPLPSGPHQPWFGYEAIEVDQLGQELADVFLRQVLRPEADTRVIGFKEIRWHEDPDLFVPMLEFLQRYMPNARFIFNTRDHEEVRVSGWWRNMKRALVLEQLETAEALYADWQVAHPDSFLAMHYNDYAKDPEAWRPLFDFLELPFDPALTETILSRKLMHMKWQKPLSSPAASSKG
ncbi:sulfotransferase [Pseudophaeobacter sp.]|uniref:sulfotransferase n=1 Tax=Pseudophaeobacter sp. TaxID=1971739 RepID=UPI003296CDFF